MEWRIQCSVRGSVSVITNLTIPQVHPELSFKFICQYFTSILYIAFKSQSNSTKELIIIRIIPFYIICLLKKASPFLMSPCNFCCSLRDSIRYLFISFVRSFVLLAIVEAVRIIYYFLFYLFHLQLTV